MIHAGPHILIESTVELWSKIHMSNFDQMLKIEEFDQSSTPTRYVQLWSNLFK